MATPGFSKGRLKNFIERVQRLEEEKAGLMADIRGVYAEAKAQGFDTRIMHQVVRLLKLDTADRQEQRAVLDHYLEEMGMK